MEWFDRYRSAIEEYHLPKGVVPRQEYAEVIGADGMQLLEKVWADSGPSKFRSQVEKERKREVLIDSLLRYVDSDIKYAFQALS